ncbi:MAG: hypothetical protein A3I66_12035 [Burkholderiales bacterium RIFCSPLOWO2_02_FULL_57_36]|nr:MAG: hypothetical protein A3I66_12035 [Burkholderiales bacterium RIFCSPLOWO2_02_FULL_57_36]
MKNIQRVGMHESRATAMSSNLRAERRRAWVELSSHSAPVRHAYLYLRKDWNQASARSTYRWRMSAEAGGSRKFYQSRSGENNGNPIRNTCYE